MNNLNNSSFSLSSQQNNVFGTFNANSPLQSKPFGSTMSAQSPIFGSSNLSTNSNQFNSQVTLASNNSTNTVFGSTGSSSLFNSGIQPNQTTTATNNLFSPSNGSNIFGNVNTSSFPNQAASNSQPQLPFGTSNTAAASTSNTGFIFNNNLSQSVSTTTNNQLSNAFSINPTSTPLFGSTTISSQNAGISTSTGFPFGSGNSSLGTSNSLGSNIPNTSTNSNFVIGSLSSNQNTSSFSFGSTQANPGGVGRLGGVTSSPSNATFDFQLPTLVSKAPTGLNSSQNSFMTPVSTTNNSIGFSGSEPKLSLTTLAPIVTTGSTMFSLNDPNTSSPVSLSSTKLNVPTSSQFLSTNLSIPSTTPTTQSAFGLNTTTGLGGISNSKSLIGSNVSPLAISSVSSKKGLGGSPISESAKSVVSNDAAQKISIVKQVKDQELQPELKETVEAFKKFVTEQKKLREEVIKSKDVLSLMLRVEEESQTLRQSISEVANGLQKIQSQSNKLKSDIAKEQSNSKIAQISSDTTINVDRSESANYFANKVRELENRANRYQQEIEVVESMCSSSNKSAMTTRDLVEIIRKMDDEFIGLAAKLYNVHERVKAGKAEFLRRSKMMNNQQNPFIAIEGRFGETFETNGASRNYKKPSIAHNSSLIAIDNIGGSPFENSYMNQPALTTSNKAINFQKPTIFGINNNNQSIISATTTSTTPFSFSSSPTSFAINKPNNLFLTDTVSKKRR